MGIVPLWGFQLIIAIALAFVFRLNKVLVILAANISIPPMIPVILFVSHLTGAIWMGEDAQYLVFNEELTLERVKTSFVQYLLGAITLAVMAGILFTGIAYAGLKIFKKQNV
jgi:uncharacterized protein (DUF2062 family)